MTTSSIASSARAARARASRRTTPALPNLSALFGQALLDPAPRTGALRSRARSPRISSEGRANAKRSLCALSVSAAALQWVWIHCRCCRHYVAPLTRASNHLYHPYRWLEGERWPATCRSSDQGHDTENHDQSGLCHSVRGSRWCRRVSRTVPISFARQSAINSERHADNQSGENWLPGPRAAICETQDLEAALRT